MTSYTCIYCRQQKLIEGFNREHLIPEAYGKFKDNLVLSRQVCRECNQFFGNNLELALARGSPPGVVRSLLGRRPLSGLKKAITKRVSIRTASNDPLKSDEVDFIDSADGGGVALRPGIKYWSTDGSSWKFASLESLESNISGLLDDLDIGQPVVITGSGVDESDAQQIADRVTAALTLYGKCIEYNEELEKSLPGQQIRIAVEVIEDHLTWRAIAKIAFNYLAYARGSAFALNKGFDEIRNYIRYGTAADKQLVTRVSSSPFHGGWREANSRQGHYVIIDWSKTGSGVVGAVSLFQVIHYQVQFGSYEGVLPGLIAKGSYFDWRTNEITDIQAVSHLSGIEIRCSNP